jgi:hypothetical protein
VGGQGADNRAVSSRWRIAVVAVVAAAVAYAGLAGTGRVAARGAAGAGANRHAAAVDAAALLGRLRLPAGASRSATEPSGGGAALAVPGDHPATPNLVDDHAWWVVPEAPAAVLSFIGRHHPAGSRLVQSGSGDIAPGYRVLAYGWPARLHVLSTRWLVIQVVSLRDGSTALRADAVVVWITPRLAGERIPAAVARVKVSVISAKRVVRGPFTISVVGRVRRARSLIDKLPASQPGAASCPEELGLRVRLVFYGRAGQNPLAVALVDPAGCESVSLTIAGRPQHPLTSLAFPGSRRRARPSLVHQLETLLDLRLNVVAGR